MNVTEAINIRRAYRSLKPINIEKELIVDLATHASLSPSCNNNQPWRFIFVVDKEQLKKIHSALPKGNKWMELSSMIIIVFSRIKDDCVVKTRIYNLFDTGMAVAFLILRATELGLVAHPVAGYDEEKIKQTFEIPEEYQIITLINIGKHSEKIHPFLSIKQAEIEEKRPERKKYEGFASIDKYSGNN